MRKILSLLVLVTVSFLLVSCGSEEVTENKLSENSEKEEVVMKVVSDGVAQVVISNAQFMPTDLEIKAGTTVEWNNADTKDHTITFENGDFDEILPVGASVTYTFEEVGELRYFCQFHPGMQGNIIVS
tara:strand:- start:1477 stop:1860 length:384 start_codon:yes stop_codon:yes gene_type:complete